MLADTMATSVNPYDPPTESSQGDQPPVTHGAPIEWGVGAIAISGLLLVMCPVALLLAVGIWEFADRSTNVVVLHAWLARLGVALVAVLCVTSVVFAVTALRGSVASGSSRAIPITGAVLSVTASLAWVITAIALLNTTESMLLLYSR